MGCISSKQVRSPPRPQPDFDSTTTTVTVRHNGPASAHLDSLFLKRGGFGELEKIKEEPEKENEEDSVSSRNREPKKSRSTKKGSSEKKAVFSLRFGRYTEAEQIAAGWPPWLSAVAGEAVEGWLPLRADLFEKLDKVGQGTYSSVYRARDVETGRIVALKKVRFDTFQPESVRFMAREITILRRLDHQNIMKLEGLITNRLSCSIYLVFEYMEHDLSGLLSCHDIKFSDSQIKCYMRQLLAGLEHCHSRGVMHRDIKASNILVNNEGILKIADFGLANYINVRHRQALTSRVVTLWYRPPELLLGSTNYGASVDMWSVGCVFAELFIGKPILKGRTEVEQLHKIFRLCGSPPDEYWKKSKLPLATMFKPQHPYVSSLRERCKEFPKSAVNLLETFLSIEPHKRGTASSALDSEYFTTKPFACDPSSLPRYPPSKEIDAKIHEERRRKASARTRASGTSRNPRRSCKPLQGSSSISKVEVGSATQFSRRNNGGHAHVLKAKGASESRELLRSSYDTVSEASQATEISQVDSIQSVPAVSASTDFAWAKKRRGNGISTRLCNQASSRVQNFNAFDPSSVLHSRFTSDSEEQENEEFSSKICNDTQGSEACEAPKRVTWRQQTQPYRSDLFDASDCHSQELSVMYHRDKDEQMKRVPFSGPLLSYPHRLAEGQENHIRQTVHNRSRIYRG
ncbi:protein IMPAIRED IN BABA-INDUCED STERILITY 1-like isoform X1 [Actinidia eriantha]|uniref:protein IMPAIRED IN BABA-INDUCED STERILITY 1-like isoform X1 n=1 Tax=Actinidia eriantha TaxID=165200 RepID=UPI0025908FAA|nr:protein IMPAIRED IN BABA-INDUCED STERILITY 1-like isoform X1 [Actinidia eriantha]